jgi:tetrahydromethanopterin S-methyltransferase subunit F
MSDFVLGVAAGMIAACVLFVIWVLLTDKS